MSAELYDFFERLDGVLTAEEGGASPSPEQLADDEEVDRRGRLLAGIYLQRAERAGVDLDTLVDIIQDRCGDTARAVQIRMSNADEPDEITELLHLATAAGMQFFLAGVLWEQHRHLPNLEA